MFNFLKKNIRSSVNGKDMLDDVSYIREIRHIPGTWHQYDILLAARGYGWETMTDWAAYMEAADLDQISTVTVGETAHSREEELIDQYRNSSGTLKEFSAMKTERGMLAIGGISRILGVPVKVIWFNQTRVLRLFTPEGDEQLMKRYTETMIRRTFGTPDEMKEAKPVPDNE